MTTPEDNETRRLEAELFDANERIRDLEGEVAAGQALVERERADRANELAKVAQRHEAEQARLREQAVADRQAFERALQRLGESYRAEFREHVAKLRADLAALAEAVDQS